MTAFAHHLVVFMKAPRLGAVKTRLARDIGAVPACAFYRTQAARLLRDLGADSRWRCWLAVTPDHAYDGIPTMNGRWRTIPQGAGDLGRRMDRTMRTLPPGPAVIVGTDIPGITRMHVARAFRALGAHDAVFGPAADGGYWLVGLKRRPRIVDIFENVRWSSEHALADTLANFDTGRRIAFLDKLEDVDEGAAYARWRKTA